MLRSAGLFCRKQLHRNYNPILEIKDLKLSAFCTASAVLILQAEIIHTATQLNSTQLMEHHVTTEKETKQKRKS